MATRTHRRLVKQPDPFALDSSSEEFFALGDRPTPVVERIDLELEEEDVEVARRSAPEVVLRRRRYRRLVTRVVCGLSLVALSALAKSALRPADAAALHLVPARVAHVAPPAEPTPSLEVAAAPAEEPTSVATEPPPAVAAPPKKAPPAKIARAAARDDDFSDLDVKIDVPKIDMPKLDFEYGAVLTDQR